MKLYGFIVVTLCTLSLHASHKSPSNSAQQNEKEALSEKLDQYLRDYIAEEISAGKELSGHRAQSDKDEVKSVAGDRLINNLMLKKASKDEMRAAHLAIAFAQLPPIKEGTEKNCRNSKK